MSDVNVTVTEDTVTVGVPGVGFELTQVGTYVASDDVTDIVVLTQAAYDALTPEATTLYIVEG